MEDRELEKQYYDRKKKRVEAFANDIDFETLFTYIRKVTGLDDLKFTVKINEDRYGYAYPVFSTDNIIDVAPEFLKLTFSELTISSFNSQINANEPKDYHDLDYTQDYPLRYWCTVALDWAGYNGGTNGKTFLSAHYDETGWNMVLERDRY